jgi:hypothetical protein
VKIKKLVANFGVLFFFSVPSAVAANQPQVILDQLLTGDAPALNSNDLNIPKDLSPGFHELTVEIYDEKGVISTKSALFCKDTKGELHFDNNCPDLLIKKKAKKVPFNPLTNPDETINFVILAFALTGALLGIGNRSDEGGSLESLDSRELAAGSRKLSWGDRRKYIRFTPFNFLDEAPKSLARQIEKVSTLFARIVLDARYLRVIFTNISWLTLPAAIWFSYQGTREIQNLAVPMSFGFTLTLILIGLFDSFAGLAGAFIYLDLVFANGHLDSKNSLLFSIGYVSLFFAPALIASKFRPLHRSINYENDWWTRFTDYALGALLTGFATASLVKALNGLYGYELQITKYAGQIGVYVSLALLVRMLIEEFAWYLYPNRTRELHFQLTPDGAIKKSKALILKIALLLFFSYPLIGWNRYLAIGLAVVFGPQLLSFVSSRFVKPKFLSYINPRGAVRIVTLGIIGIAVVQTLTIHGYTDQQILLNTFIFAPIPAAIFSLMDQFTNPKRIKVSGRNLYKYSYRYGYRLMGILIFITLCVLLSGHNPIEEFQKFWNNPSDTWNSLTYKWWPQVKADYQSLAHWIAVKRGVA